jgi:hypothetical protein
VFTANIYNPQSTFFSSPNASGDPTNGGLITTAAQAGVPMPVACTFDKIYLSTNAVASGFGTGGAITVTMYKNGLATALTSSGSNTNAAVSFATASVAVSAGDLISIYGSGVGFTTGQAPLSVSMHCQ